MDVLFNSFAAGEWSQLMEGRTDLPLYYQSCRKLENLVALPQGGAQARPGFEYVNAAKATTGTLLCKFVYKKIQGYVLEFGDTYFRVYKDGARLEDGDPIEVVTPYETIDLPHLMFVSTWDQLYVFSPDYATRVITRTSHTSWTITAVGYTFGPFLTENTTAVTLNPSAATGTIDLVASSALLDATHVGALFSLTHQVSETTIAGILFAVGNSSTITRKGKWDFIITGTWEGTIILQRSYDAGSTWYDVRVITHPASMSNSELNQGEEVDDAVMYRVRMSVRDSGIARYELRFSNAWQVGIVQIATVANTTEATATVINTLGGTTATAKWAEGSWSGYRGYPVCGAFFQQRVWSASTAFQPHVTWAGQSYKEAGDYSTMKLGNLPDDALEYRLPIPGIRWMVDSDYLLLGTDQGIWKVSSTDEKIPITPTNINVRPQNAEACAAIQPLKISNRVAYVGAGRKRVYLLDLLQTYVYQATDLTINASHICGTGITGWDVMEKPFKSIWAWTDDGDIVVIAQTGPEQIACSRIVMEGDVKSLTILPGSGAEDEVWVVVNRTINDTAVTYIEKMGLFDWGSDQNNAFLVDSGVTNDNGAAVAVTKTAIAAVTNKVTITATGHGLSDDDNVRFADLTKTTELNEGVYTVADKADDTFVLKNEDASAYIDGSDFEDEGTCTGTVEVVVDSVAVTHLTGESLAVMGDGADIGPIDVESDAIDLDGWYNTIHCGLSYDYPLQPQRPELRTTHGSIQGRKKKISDIILRVYKTGALKIGSSADDLESVVFADLGDEDSDAIPLLSGDTECRIHPGGWSDDGSIWIQGSSPMPMTICAIIFDLDA